MRGPIPFAHYMKEALTHPVHGYYMKKDVFGQKGDFTTSPEISQMFGEMVGVWCMHMWEQMGKPSTLHLVEFGPGRGTLMGDMLRAMKNNKTLKSALRVHLIEVSRVLRTIQKQTLAPLGTEINWHDSVDDLPNDGPLLVIAHEFFDALPVHLFRYRENKTQQKGEWREILVDSDTSGPHHFRLVLSPHPTAICSAFSKWFPIIVNDGDGFQLSIESMALVEKLFLRIASQGGGSLIIDYGENRTLRSSVVTIRNHTSEHVLENPGQADVSAWVDFRMLRKVLQESKVSNALQGWGPVPQGTFLREMGIDYRMLALVKAVGQESEQAEGVVEAYNRLIEGKHMGATYKAWAFCQKGISPAGFNSVDDEYIID